jgi:ribosomal protein L2
MALVKLKPTSPGRRGMVKVVNPDLHKGRPFAGLVEKKSKSAGRNNNGHITTRHLGGGHKLLISVAIRMASQRRLSVSSMTLTAARTLHCFVTRMVSVVTSSPAKAWR